MEKIYCSNCGAQNTSDSKYCKECGQKLIYPASNKAENLTQPEQQTARKKEDVCVRLVN